MKQMLKNVRLAFPSLFEARTVNGEGKPAYSATFIIAGDDKEQLAAINAAIEATAKEKWGAKAGEVLKALRAKGTVALKDGATKAEYEGYEGNWFIAARTPTRPTVIDADKTPLTEADGRPYSGCYVNASVEFWAQDNQFGKRINASLRGVQFVKDGDSFGGGARAADVDEFDSVEDTADIF